MAGGSTPRPGRERHTNRQTEKVCPLFVEVDGRRFNSQTRERNTQTDRGRRLVLYPETGKERNTHKQAEKACHPSVTYKQY